ncbi:MAG: hypothetical protein U0796_02715 [Gemmatales bacterium]
MRDCLDIGPAPAEETCVSVGEQDYARKAKIECQQFIEAIKKSCGEPPLGADLRVKSNPHDFGNYYSVACYFDEQYPESVEYAYKCEAHAPTTWEAVDMHPPSFKARRGRM